MLEVLVACEISSIPWVRPSSVLKGMKLSGTNSVIPPVRSCSARITRMWRASSRGSSMWPNITVEVERRPARWEASMISTQRATGQLVRRDPLADAVVEHLGGRPRGRAEPALEQVLEDLVRALAGALAHVVDLHRRVGVEVDLRRAPPWPAAASARTPRGVRSGWMPPCMQSSVAPKSTASSIRAGEVLLGDFVGVGRALALAEAAEGAADDADVGEVDVAVDDEGDAVSPASSARSSSAATRISSITSGRVSAKSAVSSSSRQLLPSRPFSIARGGQRPASRLSPARRPEPRRGMKLQYLSLTTSRTPCSIHSGSMYCG